MKTHACTSRTIFVYLYLYYHTLKPYEKTAITFNGSAACGDILL